MALMVENNRSTPRNLPAVADELMELTMPLRPTDINLLTPESSKLRGIADNTSSEELSYFNYQVASRYVDISLIERYQKGTLPSARSLVLAA